MSTVELVGIITAVLVFLPLSYGVARWVRNYMWKRALPYHPLELKTARGPLEPCSFFIKPDYQSDIPLHRWKSDADIEVATVDVNFPPDIRVYLIASGRAPRSMHNPQVYKHDPKALLIKSQASQRFANKSLGQEQELKGFWFRSVKDYPMLYSTPYDNALKRSSSRW